MEAGDYDWSTNRQTQEAQLSPVFAQVTSCFRELLLNSTELSHPCAECFMLLLIPFFLVTLKPCSVPSCLKTGK